MPALRGVCLHSFLQRDKNSTWEGKKGRCDLEKSKRSIIKIDEFVLPSNSSSRSPSFLRALSQVLKRIICEKQKDLLLYSKMGKKQTDVIGERGEISNLSRDQKDKANSTQTLGRVFLSFQSHTEIKLNLLICNAESYVHGVCVHPCSKCGCTSARH